MSIIHRRCTARVARSDSSWRSSSDRVPALGRVAGYLVWGEWQKRASFVYVLCCISLLGGFQQESSVDGADSSSSVDKTSVDWADSSSSVDR